MPWTIGSPLWLRKKGTGSCIPLPSLSRSLPLIHFRAMTVTLVLTFVLTLLLDTTVLAAYTDEFLQAFRNLGLDPWAGMEMDVAWGHATLRYGLHRPSIAGPIFVYRVCTRSPVAFSPRAQVLTHENLSPDQVLSAIAGHFPDLRSPDPESFPRARIRLPFGFRLSVSGFRPSAFGFRFCGFRLSVFGFPFSVFGFLFSVFLGLGFVSVFGFWALGFQFSAWVLFFGIRLIRRPWEGRRICRMPSTEACKGYRIRKNGFPKV